MSRILPSTLIQQQSFNPDWVISDDTIPTGVVISCQFTTTSTSPIYLSSMSISYGSLSIVFSQDDIVCATVTTQQGGVIIPMEINSSILSATIEIGVIPTTSIVKNFTNAVVNATYINVVSVDKRKQNKLIISQDGVVTEYVLTSDLELSTRDTLDVHYNANNGEVSISMSAENYLDFTQLGDTIISPDAEINTINGIKSKNGVIKINVYNDGALIPVKYKCKCKGKCECKELNWVELENSPDITFCPDFVDILDRYIAPSTHIGYCPLDDAYTEGGKRDTSLLLDHAYGGLGVGNKVKLTEVDETIDTK